MKNNLLLTSIAAAGMFSACAAFAAPNWIDKDVFQFDVGATVVQTNTLSMSTSSVLTSEGNVKPNNILFTINVSAEKNTKVALAGAGTTLITTEGRVSNQSSDVGVALEGVMLPVDLNKITADKAYAPPGANVSNDKSGILLLSGSNRYSITVMTPADYVEKYNAPGVYCYDFIAQAYTE